VYFNGTQTLFIDEKVERNRLRRFGGEKWRGKSYKVILKMYRKKVCGERVEERELKRE
jgi:hypothetical protein